ncbi:MAG: ABC transporter permease [Thermoanaerobaculia bacterium]
MKRSLPFFHKRRRRELELDDEIAGHLAMAVRERVARGESPHEAEAAARRELGNEALVKEAARAQWGWGSFERFRQDARYGLRLLRRSPGFAAVAILTLALGIGASTAILSVVDAILVRPLAYADPSRLVVILKGGDSPVAPANFLDWKAQSGSFEKMGAAEYWSPNLTGGDSPEKVWAIRMTADVLPLLGVRPALGRFFLPSETAAGANHVVVLGHAVWKSRFGADPAILGKEILLDGEPYSVVGVMPPSFQFAPFWATNAQLWAPLDLAPRASNRNGSSLRIFARLKPGIALESARREMASITAELDRQFPGTNRDMQVLPLLERVVGDVRPALLVLLAAVGLVLAIACANVANMLLARSSARQREVALRAALGASRGRTIRQLLTESLVLAAAGGLAGAALGAWGLRLLLALAPEGIPRLAEVSLDPRIFLAIFAVALLSGAAFGIAPALEASAVHLQPALKEGGSAGAGREGGRLRRAFVAAEIAIAIVLLVGAGLMIRTFLALRAIDPGWNPDGVVTLEVSLAGTAHAAPEQRDPVYRQLLERIRAVPGVAAAGAINHLPIAGDVWRFPYAVEGRPEARPGESPVTVYRAVTPGYFAAMRLPILRGRDIAETDGATAPGVVVINERFAEIQWPGEDALGRRIMLDDKNWLTVVGVVKNAVRSDWSEPPYEESYISAFQSPELMRSPHTMASYLTFVVRAARAQGVRTDGDPAALAPSLKAAVRSVDPRLPISAVRTMRDVVNEATARARFQTLLLAVFAAAAALLSAIGIYGVMSYAVSKRTREIGVRMALGADPRSVLRLVVGQGMAVAFAGAGLGLVGAFLLTRLMASLLYGVRAGDPLTFAAVAVALLLVALAASWIPARRAARIDPMRALRAE